MQEKIIHIVFQILNFLSDPLSSAIYDLSADEKLLLLFLSKHHGLKGIYPSVKTLSKELQRSDSAIRRSLKKLKEKEIISITYVAGKSSYYTISILSTAPSVHASTQNRPLASTLGHPWRPRQDTPSVHARQSDKRNNLLNNTERTCARIAHTLSHDFEPTKETIKIAKNAELTQEEANIEFDKFMNYYLENQKKKKDWQLVLRNWFIDAGQYKRKKGSIQGSNGSIHPRQGSSHQEVRSTVPWFKAEDAHRGAAPVAALLNGLATKAHEFMAKNGGSTNGLGRKGEGEKTKN